MMLSTASVGNDPVDSMICRERVCGGEKNGAVQGMSWLVVERGLHGV